MINVRLKQRKCFSVLSEGSALLPRPNNLAAWPADGPRFVAAVARTSQKCGPAVAHSDSNHGETGADTQPLSWGRACEKRTWKQAPGTGFCSFQSSVSLDVERSSQPAPIKNTFDGRSYAKEEDGIDRVGGIDDGPRA